jgi:hypothetical protein
MSMFRGAYCGSKGADGGSNFRGDRSIGSALGIAAAGNDAFGRGVVEADVCAAFLNRSLEALRSAIS